MECFGLLAAGNLGRVAVVDDRGPVVFPVSFVLDRHTVVFRTEPGTKLCAARQGSLVCLEADEALAVMLDGYLSCAATGQPVHTWPA